MLLQDFMNQHTKNIKQDIALLKKMMTNSKRLSLITSFLSGSKKQTLIEINNELIGSIDTLLREIESKIIHLRDLTKIEK